MQVLLRNAGIGFVGGVLLWGTGDVVGELTTYYKLRDRALELANQSEGLKAQVGYPYTPGPWYDAKIGFLGGGSMAQCTFQLQGDKQITDITVRGIRAKGFQNRALYNLLGPGIWSVIDCTAMFPDSNGLVQPRSLLLESKPQQQQQQQPQGKACKALPSNEAEPHHGQASTNNAPNQEKQGWFSGWWGKSRSSQSRQIGDRT